MIPEFPHSLVTLTTDEISDTIVSNSIETEFDSGPPRRAPRDSLPLRRRNVTYVTCSKEDFLEFQRWFVRDTKSGTKHFLWKDFMDGEWKRVRCTPGDFVARPLDRHQEQWEIPLEFDCIEEY